MTTYRRWVLPLALVGGAAIGAVLTLRLREERGVATTRQHREDLQAWEGEGGSVAMPPMPQHEALDSESRTDFKQREMRDSSPAGNQSMR
jgi:hypothetical protein